MAWFDGVRTWLRQPPARQWPAREGVAPPTNRLEAYWPVLAGVVLVIIAAVSVLLAVIALTGYEWADLAPWVLGAFGGVCVIGALMAFSYAPPGPNWIERIAGIDGGTVLVLLGGSMTVFGTFGLFDFNTESEDPSVWWVALVAAGVILLLVGVARERPGDPHRALPPPDPATRVELVKVVPVTVAAPERVSEDDTIVVAGPVERTGR